MIQRDRQTRASRPRVTGNVIELNEISRRAPLSDVNKTTDGRDALARDGNCGVFLKGILWEGSQSSPVLGDTGTREKLDSPNKNRVKRSKFKLRHSELRRSQQITINTQKHS
jgi:hypothetical protein